MNFSPACHERNLLNLKTHPQYCNKMAGIYMITLLVGAFLAHWEICNSWNNCKYDFKKTPNTFDFDW